MSHVSYIYIYIEGVTSREGDHISHPSNQILEEISLSLIFIY
jgi:hypothetical protein